METGPGTPLADGELHNLQRRAGALAPVATLLADLRLEGAPALWLVGGAVRDLLLDVEPLDIDLMVAGDLEPLIALLDGEVRRHHSYLTAEIAGVDLAQARRERYAQPGSLPVVEPAAVEDDLRRRDFTVNAIALGLSGPTRGQMRSVEHAFDDLGARQLRVLHDASFRDDPTRLLRLARYVARLDFSVEAHTLDLAREAVDAGVLDTVSGVRIGNELRKLAAEPDPVRGFVALRELGVDGAIDPAVGLIDDGLAARALALLEPGDRGDRVVLAAALLGAPEDHLVALLDRLGFVAEDRAVIVAAVVNADRISRRLEYAGPPSEIDWAAGGPHARPELVALAGAIHPANAAREWLVELRHRRITISGDDLIAAGVPAGPSIAAGLAGARAAMLDDEAPDAATQLAAALVAAQQAAKTWRFH